MLCRYGGKKQKKIEDPHGTSLKRDKTGERLAEEAGEQQTTGNFGSTRLRGQAAGLWAAGRINAGRHRPVSADHPGSRGNNRQQGEQSGSHAGQRTPVFGRFARR